jgi:hypothetical protein
MLLTLSLILLLILSSSSLLLLLLFQFNFRKSSGGAVGGIFFMLFKPIYFLYSSLFSNFNFYLYPLIYAY